MNEILAKSNPEISLDTHISDCLLIEQELFKSIPALTNISDKYKFFEVLKLSIIFHDLGKSNPEFQKLLKGKTNCWNNKRHELYSVPFIKNSSFNAFDQNLVLISVLSHHKTFEEIYEKESRKNLLNNLNLEGVIENSSEDLNIDEESFCIICNILKKYDISLNNNPKYSFPGEIKYYLNANNDSIIKFECILMIGALKHCDHLGSAGIKEIIRLEKSDFEYLTSLRNELIKKDKDFYPHQRKSSKIHGNVILNAPTGSGKTESALLWLKSNLKKIGQGRAYYILPFTASINAMYERLNKDIGSQNKVGMLHGKLTQYLYKQFEGNDIASRNKEILKQKDKFKKITCPLKVVTPFQLLKHIFGVKGFELGFVEMYSGFYIFDEIHAYNPEVMAQILILIEYIVKKLKGYVFIMSATIPGYLKKMIDDNIGKHKDIYLSNTFLDTFNRHKINLINDNIDNYIELISEGVNNGKKVLVVCNTIQTSQNIYQKLKECVNSERKSVLLHSRFNGIDRADKESRIYKGNIDLLVGTQAIEVSLDIDYDIIYTELAPLDALIQRFGRVNRRLKKGICSCTVFCENNERDFYIYNKERMQNTLKCLENISSHEDGILFESRLQQYIDIVYPGMNEYEKNIFDITYNSLNYSIKQLNPFKRNSQKENDFYKQFDGIKVLPIKYESDYLECINNGDYIGAENYEVSINKKYFAVQINNMPRKIFKKCILTNREEFYYYVIDNKYNSDLGLLNEVENDDFTFL
jgi:CRISPR-associated endonuclease/helicase Cas3